MNTVILNNLEWMTENLSGHNGIEVNGNWHYTWEQAMEAAEEVGNGWRLPTADEFAALCNLDNTWDEEHKGRLFDNTLFLPAAGYGKYSNSYNVLTEGNYWTCICKNASIWHLTFNSRRTTCYDYPYTDTRLSARLVRDVNAVEPNHKKVYALFDGCYNTDYECNPNPLKGIFSTFKKAIEAKEKLTEINDCDYFITETTLNKNY